MVKNVGETRRRIRLVRFGRNIIFVPENEVERTCWEGGCVKLADGERSRSCISHSVARDNHTYLARGLTVIIKAVPSGGGWLIALRVS